MTQREQDKDARCAASGCPLAGTGDARCARCTGPVSWTDRRGQRTGTGGATHRQCTSCPMNGLGLPVCWAACDGPQTEFQTDGQRVVSLGGMADADRFIASQSAKIVADEFCDGENAEADGDNGRGRMAMMLASRLLAIGGRRWNDWRDACARRDASTAARIAGVPRGAFRGPGGGWDGSVADRMMSAIGDLDSDNWEVIRRLAMGDAQTKVAEVTGVRKQATNQRLGRLARSREWVVRLLKK